ncbi:phage head closure protein [Pseudaminobacter sp. NGMCC 1.201702]|uniref:phage head closure protein n=1 Tax=Pseudaminobacter sp. NGMCC 1.201702 TaxID=3391825 RepID=UPI0039EE389E
MGLQFIDPGRLRHELTVEECTYLPDSFGGHTETWVEIATLFAMIEPISARSVFGAGQSLETVTHRVTIRWRDGVRSGMRFRKQGRVFSIVTTHDPDESGRYLVCQVKEQGL